MTDDWVALGKDKRILTVLLFKVIAYYTVVFGLVFVLLSLFPGVLPHLPLGGVGELSGAADLEVSQLEEALLSGDYDPEVSEGLEGANQSMGSVFRDAQTLFISMFGSLVLMFPVSWVYRAIHRHGEHDHSLDETTLILPAIVAGIVIVVQHSLALAFSLAGIVAGVQFRRALSDTFDTLFIFVSIAVGIAAGIRALDIASVIVVFFTITTLLVCIFGDGLESQHVAERKQAKVRDKAALAAKRESESV